MISVATELIQWYYENRSEDLGIGQMIEMPSWYPVSTHSGDKCLLEALDLLDLAKFMSTNVFGAGATPTDCQLRGLTVRIDLADYTPEWKINELLAPILTQHKSTRFKLCVNVVGWWTRNFDFQLISGIGSKLREAFDGLAEGAVSASARLTLFVPELFHQNPQVKIFEDVGGLLGASEEDWEEYLTGKLERRD
ncbi:hypothetical protein SLS60_004267 [Paraconiothyrium brasiliense]|uniref:Uncharacterized protein n=1 Tax=Paraconiothyrium brasiliense TaxID=300254 RepID=A0ABR3RRF7_9PLEO